LVRAPKFGTVATLASGDKTGPFAAFILTRAALHRPCAIKTGVTVLVHGFVAFENVSSTTPYEYWGGGNLRKLLERFGSGKVWEYDPASGDYLDITGRIPNGTWTNSELGQHILLFDWTDGSDEEESGQAEAAADALFASLVNFRFSGSERIISSRRMQRCDPALHRPQPRNGGG
jgi:hypothetical protein